MDSRGFGIRDTFELRLEGDQSPSLCWPGGLYFGDGSRGLHTKYPALRRCGVGVCQRETGGEI